MGGLCLSYTHALSHVSRLLEVAKVLRARGFDLRFAGEGPELTHVMAAGFPVLPLAEPDPSVLFRALRARKARFIEASLLESMVEQDRALIQKERPDFVLSDGRISAQLSCRSLKVRHAAICNVSSTPCRQFPYVPLLASGARRGRIHQALARFNLKLEMDLFDLLNPAFGSLSRSHSVSPPVTATNCLVGADLTLLPDLEFMFPIRSKPAGYHFVGPLLWRADQLEAGWRARSAGFAHTIYATMGTTGVQEFFEAVLVVAANTPTWYWIISTGRQYPLPRLLRRNVWMADYVDGDQAARDADVVVCHGGNGTTYQALLHGKPLLCMPTISDQEYNARRVESLRLGRRVHLSDFLARPSSLIESIERISTDVAIQQSLAEVRARMGPASGPEQAAEVIARHLLDAAASPTPVAAPASCAV